MPRSQYVIDDNVAASTECTEPEEVHDRNWFKCDNGKASTDERVGVIDDPKDRPNDSVATLTGRDTKLAFDETVGEFCEHVCRSDQSTKQEGVGARGERERRCAAISSDAGEEGYYDQASVGFVVAEESMLSDTHTMIHWVCQPWQKSTRDNHEVVYEVRDDEWEGEKENEVHAVSRRIVTLSLACDD